MAQGAGLDIAPDKANDSLGGRLSEGVFIIGVSVVALYLWIAFVSSDAPVIISLAALLSACASIVAAIVVKLLKPSNRTLTHSSLFALLATTSTLLILTNDPLSPFIVLASIAAIFAPLFGRIPLVITLAAIIIQLVGGLIINSDDLTSSLFTFFVYSVIPFGIGLSIGRQQLTGEGQDPMAELSSRLSTTKGKSDIVINTIEDGVLTIDGKGMIDLINPSAQKLIGWNQGDALGLDWQSVLKFVNSEGRDVPDTENPVAQSLSTNKQIHNDSLYLLTSSEKKRMVSIVSTPVSGAGSGTILVMRDITKEKTEEREQAEFISTASHEMRTPVASIEGYLGLALNPTIASIDEKARDFITKAHESAQHLGKLFQDLLDISKSEDGRLKNDPAIVDIIAATNNVFESLEPLARKKQLRYIFKQSPALETESTSRRIDPVYYADIDPGHFREVVSNLIENAIKYTGAGDIVVEVRGDDKLVTVSVSDSGIGIPVEDIPHLFQKFYRVDNTETREIGGTGLGLYLCRRLAETMGGGLRVTSEYKKGSTFYLDVPRTSHEDAMIKLNQMSEPVAEILLDDRDRIAHEPASQIEQSTLAPASQPTSSAPFEPPVSRLSQADSRTTTAQPIASIETVIQSNTAQETSYHQPPKAPSSPTLDQIERHLAIRQTDTTTSPQPASQPASTPVQFQQQPTHVAPQPPPSQPPETYSHERQSVPARAVAPAVSRSQPTGMPTRPVP